MVGGRPGIYLSRWTKTWINCVGLGVWASGLGWMAVHYILQPRSAADFNGNSEPQWLKWHGAFAVLAIWSGGMLWGLHIVKAWKQRRHRLSGGTVAGALLILIASGYGLYYVAAETARTTISLIHQAVGIAILAAYLVHRLAKKTFRGNPPL